MTYQHTIKIETPGRGIINFTDKVSELVSESTITTGLCNVFLLHTSASLIICENADPDVLRDLDMFMGRLVPDGDKIYSHVAEGPDDMPAHVRNILTQTSISIPITEAKLHLGRWQGIYLWEHRFKSYSRTVVVTIQG